MAEEAPHSTRHRILTITMTSAADDEAPTLFKKSTKAKRVPKVRGALASEIAEGEGEEPVFKPKKSVLPQRLKPNTGDRSQGSTQKRGSLYSSEYLDHLRAATPTTPKEYSSDPVATNEATTNETELDAAEERRAVEVAPGAATAIPDVSTVRHIKQQRDIRRRAGENYIPLSDALTFDARDSGDSAKRLQTEDDIDTFGGDGNEGLDGYESDSLPLGTTNAKKAERDRIALMSSMIAGHDAEEYPVEFEASRLSGHIGIGGASSSDSDDEWERTQTLKSAVSSHMNKPVSSQARIPVPELLPIPTIDQVMDRLRSRLDLAKSESENKAKLIQDIEQQQIEIADREEAIKLQLQKANLAYATAQLRLGGIESHSHI